MSAHAESSSAARPKARKAVHPADVQHATDAGLDLLRVIGRLVMHNVALPDRPDLAVDHLVAGPSGVYVINSIAPAGSVTMSSGLLVCAGTPMMDDVHEVAEAAAAVRAILSGAPVAPILCFQRSAEVAGVVGEVAVCSTENILELLSSQPDVLDAATQREVMRVLSDSLVQEAHREQRREPEQAPKPRHRQKAWSLRRSNQADAPKIAVVPPPSVHSVPPAPSVVLPAAPVLPAPSVHSVPPAPPAPSVRPVAAAPSVVVPPPPAVVLSVVPEFVFPELVVEEIIFPEIDTPAAEEVVETRVEFGVVEALVAGYAPVLGLAPRVVEPVAEVEVAEVEAEVVEAEVEVAEVEVAEVVEAEAEVVEAELAEVAEVEAVAEPSRPVGRAPLRPTAPVVVQSAARPPARLPGATPPTAGTIWRSAAAERPRAALAAEAAPAREAAPDAAPQDVLTEATEVSPRRFSLPRVDVRPALKKAGGVLAQLAPAEPVDSVSALKEHATPVHEVPVAKAPKRATVAVEPAETAEAAALHPNAPQAVVTSSSLLPSWVRKPASRQPATAVAAAPVRRRLAYLLPAAVAGVVIGAVLMAVPQVPAAVDWGKGLFIDAPTPPVGTLIQVGGTSVDPAYDVTASGPIPVRATGHGRAGYRLVAVKLRIHNDGATKLAVPVAARMQVLDALGIGYRAITTIKRTNLGPTLPKIVSVGPGATLVGTVVFSVPKSRGVDQIEYRLPDPDADALAWKAPTP